MLIYGQKIRKLRGGGNPFETQGVNPYTRNTMFPGMGSETSVTGNSSPFDSASPIATSGEFGDIGAPNVGGRTRAENYSPGENIIKSLQKTSVASIAKPPVLGDISSSTPAKANALKIGTPDTMSLDTDSSTKMLAPIAQAKDYSAAKKTANERQAESLSIGYVPKADKVDLGKDITDLSIAGNVTKNTLIGAATTVGASALTAAATGAAVGSSIPVAGTAIGAVLGVIVGVFMGIKSKRAQKKAKRVQARNERIKSNRGMNKELDKLKAQATFDKDRTAKLVAKPLDEVIDRSLYGSGEDTSTTPAAPAVGAKAMRTRPAGSSILDTQTNAPAFLREGWENQQLRH